MRCLDRTYSNMRALDSEQQMSKYFQICSIKKEMETSKHKDSGYPQNDRKYFRTTENLIFDADFPSDQSQLSSLTAAHKL